MGHLVFFSLKTLFCPTTDTMAFLVFLLLKSLMEILMTVLQAFHSNGVGKKGEGFK